MALTNENNGGIGATMLVGPTGYGSGYGGYPVAYPMMPMMGNYGGGMLGGDFGSLIVLFLFAMMFGGGFGGYGMGGFSESAYRGSSYRYSRHGGGQDELQSALQEIRDPNTRMKIQKLIEEME